MVSEPNSREQAESRRTERQAMLTSGPIGKTLLRLAAPMVIAMLAMVGFNMADTFFVGRLGTVELAAISFTFPIVLVVNSLTIGVGIGATSAISKAIGRGDDQAVRRLTTDSLSLGFIIVAVIMVVGLLTIDPLFTAMGAGPETLPLVREYMVIWYLGDLVIVIPMIGNSAIRATGDTKTPATIMLVAMTVNIVLDPLLIFGIGPFPELGLQGAAIATVAARTAAAVASTWVLMRREHMVTFERPETRVGLRSWREIIHVGLPAGITQVVVPLSMGFVTRLVSEYGVAAVAGFGVATRLEMVPTMLIAALAGILVAFVGQNWGAGHVDRVEKGMAVAYRYALIIGGVSFLVALLFATPIARAFDSTPEVVDTVVMYLRIVSLSWGLFGVMQLSASAFNALAKPLPAMILSILRMVALYVPLAYLGSLLFDVAGIFAATFVANAAAGIAAWIWLRRTLTRLRPSAATETEPA